jgi:hypothetical protein
MRSSESQIYRHEKQKARMSSNHHITPHALPDAAKDFTMEAQRSQRKHGGRMNSIFLPVSFSVQLCVSVVLFPSSYLVMTIFFVATKSPACRV